MDTILASIRRILNEDEVSPAEERHDTDNREFGIRDKDDVLLLGESMMVPPEKPEQKPEPTPAPAPAPAPVSAIPPIPDPAAPPAAPAHASAQDRAAIESLVAARTRAAAAQSFNALHEALRREQPTVAQPAAPNSPTILRAGGPTLEDLVREELRGLLSNWLDVHLPGLVETLVRSEIEKLTRRG